jgi:hypothetical protein
MQFKEAFELIEGIHRQNGAKEWSSLREEALYALKNYKNFQNWVNDLYLRTDISQDDIWEYECFDASFKALFSLVYGID